MSGAKLGLEHAHWNSAALTDVGRQRAHNEDALFDSPQQRLWAVADGMGGHDRGEVASAMVCEELAAIDAHSLADAVDAVDAAIAAVNARLLALASAEGGGVIGCTVAALLARGDVAACLWAGDSRIYRLRDGQLRQVSEDHSLAAELRSEGNVAEPGSDHVITRAVGAAESLVLDIECIRLRSGDRFLICSDGLSNELDDASMQRILIAGTAEQAANELVARANSAGGNDNITAVVADYLPASA